MIFLQMDKTVKQRVVADGCCGGGGGGGGRVLVPYIIVFTSIV